MCMLLKSGVSFAMKNLEKTNRSRLSKKIDRNKVARWTNAELKKLGMNTVYLEMMEVS